MRKPPVSVVERESSGLQAEGHSWPQRVIEIQFGKSLEDFRLIHVGVLFRKPAGELTSVLELDAEAQGIQYPADTHIAERLQQELLVTHQFRLAVIIVMQLETGPVLKAEFQPVQRLGPRYPCLIQSSDVAGRMRLRRHTPCPGGDVVTTRRLSGCADVRNSLPVVPL